MQEFEEYLKSKKIDASAFKEGEAALWENWLQLFSAVSPASFNQQKLFLINNIRRKYPLKEEIQAESTAQKASVKPKPKFKIPARPKKEGD